MIRKRILSIICTMILSSTMLSSYDVHATASNKRLWGNDRYQTCSSIVQEGWTKTSDYAVIVNGENFPDALSAATLAKRYNAPILLTQSNTLDTNTYEQLKRLQVRNVYIVGGDFVVKPSVEKSINDLGIKTIRYKGQDRTETSVEVAKQIGTDNGIILTTDSDFTDALSVAPIAAKLQIPIILIPKDSIPDSVKKFISGRNISKTYILGGTSLISDSVASKFPSVQRIDGNDKYERNINIINAFSDKFNIDNIYFAYSEKFADALSGSAIASIDGNPIILMGDSASSKTISFIQNKLDLIKHIYILGGNAGIKDSEVNKLINNSVTKYTDTSLLDKLKPFKVYGSPDLADVSVLENKYKSYKMGGDSLFWNLNGQCKTLKFSTACRDGQNSGGKILIYGDGHKIAETPNSKPGEGIKEYVIDVSNIKVLNIESDEDYATLINPTVSKSESYIGNSLVEDLKPFKIDGSPEISDISVLGNTYMGYKMGGDSLYWNLNGNYKTLKFSTACRDNQNSGGKILIYGDGQKIAEIPNPKPAEDIKEYVIDVSNIKVLNIKSDERYATLINPTVE